MTLDTSECSAWAARFANMMANVSLPDPKMQSMAASIQNQLESLSGFFSRLEKLARQNEESLSSDIAVFTHTQGAYASGSMGSMSALLKGQKTTSSFTAGYTVSSCEVSKSFSHGSASLQAGLGEVRAVGKASLDLVQKNKFDPELKLSGVLSAHVIGVQATGRLKTDYASVTATAKGEAGCVYAKAEAVLSKKEQSLNLDVGAAALRGECKLAFSLFGATVTLTATGSLCSAEAGMEYSFKNREWEVGAKLGFIAGIGFKLKIAT